MCVNPFRNSHKSIKNGVIRFNKLVPTCRFTHQTQITKVYRRYSLDYSTAQSNVTVGLHDTGTVQSRRCIGSNNAQFGESLKLAYIIRKLSYNRKIKV